MNKPLLVGFVLVGYAVVGMLVGCRSDDAEDGRMVLRGSGEDLASLDGLDPDLLPPRFERFSVADGLSSGHVRAILQDRQGFLWVATYDGLNRYDGATFTAFHPDPDDPRSLGDNVTHVLFEDRAGQIWIGTESGTDRFDPATETFTHYHHNPTDPASLGRGAVRAIAEDAAGTLWVGTWGGGLNRLDPATGTFARFEHDDADPASLVNDNVFALYADPGGALWVGTAGGLDRLRPPARSGPAPATGAFAHVPYRPSGGTPSRSVAFALYRDRGGVLWVGTYEEGLFRLDPATGTTRHYPAGPDGLGHPWVLTIFEDDAGTLWAGTDGGGLHRYDPARDAFDRFAHDPADPTSLSDDRVLSVVQDRSGVLWVGTSRGLNRRLPLSEVVAHERHRPGDPTSLSADDVTAFVEDSTGALWVGTDGGGLNRRDPATGAFERIRLDPAAPASGNTDAVLSLAVDDEGTVWAGTYDGLFRRDPSAGSGQAAGAGRFARFTVPDSTGEPEPFGTVTALTPGARGRLWVATQHGLFDVDPRAGRAVHYVPDPADRTSLSSRVVQSLLTDAGGQLWAGVGHGALDRFDPDTRTFAHLRLDAPDARASSAGYVSALLRTRSGALWVGTSDGLERFSDETAGRAVRRYGRADGLPNTAINGLLEDDTGRIWIATNRGLSRLDPHTETFTSFGARDGLQSDLSNERAVYRSPSTGTFYVGGDAGYNAFDPARFPERPPPGPVVLTGLRLLNEPVRVGAEGSPLVRPLARTDELRLGPADAVVTVAFAALDFAAPAQHRYAVRLAGLHDDWLDVGPRREATFTRLPPGRYTLRVRAAGRDGVWGEPSAPLAVTVVPPWWRTTWAYLAYGLLLLGGVYAVERGQRRRLVARERERTRERELEQAREIERAYTELKTTQAQLVQSEKMASLGALTAGIAHEIKNPLNFVNNFAALSRELVDELDREADPAVRQALLADLKQNATKIEEHGRRADAIVRAMMEHARNGTGERQAVGLNDLVEEYAGHAWHGRRARHPGFEVTLAQNLAGDAGEVEVVPQEIGRVLINLLDNAFDAVRARAEAEGPGYAPTVTLATHRVNGHVEVRVADNGPGMPENVRERVFEPFFTTKPTGSGTGLGLSMSYDIVTHGHGGTLACESAEGGGAVFRMALPAR